MPSFTAIFKDKTYSKRSIKIIEWFLKVGQNGWSKAYIRKLYYSYIELILNKKYS